MGVLKACRDIVDHQPAYKLTSDADFDANLKSIEIEKLALKVKRRS